MVAGVQRQSGGTGGRGDEEVHGSSAPCITPCGGDGSIDPTVGTGCFDVEGKRVECRFRALQSVLSTSTFVSVFSCMWSGCKLGHGHCTDCQLERELSGIEVF